MKAGITKVIEDNTVLQKVSNCDLFATAKTLKISLKRRIHLPHTSVDTSFTCVCTSENYGMECVKWLQKIFNGELQWNYVLENCLQLHSNMSAREPATSTKNITFYTVQTSAHHVIAGPCVTFCIYFVYAA